MWSTKSRKPAKSTVHHIEICKPLSCIIHLLARRRPQDDGFMIVTQCMSTQEIEYFSHERLMCGETLQLKLVCGPHVLDLVGTVEGVAPAHGRGPLPRIKFVNATDRDRRILESLIDRHKANIA